MLAATIIPAATASARGDGWTFLEQGDFTGCACGTKISETIVANKEFAKLAVDYDGVLHYILVTGVVKVLVTNTDTRESLFVNASGTGHDSTQSPNGDFLFTSSGPALILQTRKQARESGLPTLFLNRGNMVIFFGADGSTELRSRTGALTDLCPAIT